MKEIKLSINPSYLCNFRCSFCYLTDAQLSDRNRMDLDYLEDRLLELKNLGFNVSHVDLYGGEIALLPSDYLFELKELVQKYFPSKFNVITNMSKMNSFFKAKEVEMSVSYDFKARQMSDKVWSNISKIDKDINLLILASREVIKMDVGSMIDQINTLKNIKSVEIKPYSTNQANQDIVSNREYENFLIDWVSSRGKKFEFINEEILKQVIRGEGHSFSDDHLYITPKGKFAVLDFDQEDNEMFTELEDIFEYLEWSQQEILEVNNNDYCKKCPYLGRCLTEHYRKVLDHSDSCTGYLGLIDWYKLNERRK